MGATPRRRRAGQLVPAVLAHPPLDRREQPRPSPTIHALPHELAPRPRPHLGPHHGNAVARGVHAGDPTRRLQAQVGAGERGHEGDRAKFRTKRTRELDDLPLVGPARDLERQLKQRQQAAARQEGRDPGAHKGSQGPHRDRTQLGHAEREVREENRRAGGADTHPSLPAKW